MQPRQVLLPFAYSQHHMLSIFVYICIVSFLFTYFALSYDDRIAANYSFPTRVFSLPCMCFVFVLFYDVNKWNEVT